MNGCPPTPSGKGMEMAGLHFQTSLQYEVHKNSSFKDLGWKMLEE